MLRSAFRDSRKFLNITGRKRRCADQTKIKPQIGRWNGPKGVFPTDFSEIHAEWFYLPEDQMPVDIVLPGLSAPALVTGDKFEEDGLTFTSFNAVTLRPDNNKPADKQQGLFTPFSPDAFCKFIGKIAHSAAAAEFGANAFDPLLPPYILGHRFDYNRAFGQTPGGRIKRDQTVQVKLLGYGEYLAASVQLFAQHGMKPYLVLVGRPKTWLGLHGRFRHIG